MKAAIPYLTLPGTCAEALVFYCEVFGAEVTIRQTLGESPMDVPPEAESLIFNAEIRAGEFVLKASDNPQSDSGEPPVSAIAVFAPCESAAEQQKVFEALAGKGGNILFPLADGFGMVVDRFGTPWMLALADE